MGEGTLLIMYFSCFHPECEKLIRRMLQLEPSKRIPLSKVLEHRWMLMDEGTEPSMSTPLAHSKSRTASGNVMWNDQVLLAIQRMKCNVENVKQVCPSVNDYV